MISLPVIICCIKKHKQTKTTIWLVQNYTVNYTVWCRKKKIIYSQENMVNKPPDIANQTNTYMWDSIMFFRRGGKIRLRWERRRFSVTEMSECHVRPSRTEPQVTFWRRGEIRRRFSLLMNWMHLMRGCLKWGIHTLTWAPPAVITEINEESTKHLMNIQRTFIVIMTATRLGKRQLCVHVRQW